MTELTTIKKIMGKNFIGPEELEKIAQKFNIQKPSVIDIPTPPISYPKEFLDQVKDDYILILGVPHDGQEKPLTINQMREHLGQDPKKFEPCFYNQDWYVEEDFATKRTLDFKWYLIRKDVKDESRGKNPDDHPELLENKASLPMAILTCFTFFAYYFCTHKILWENDFIWCEDLDTNGDRIYTGRYNDPTGTNKNGFNVHRHLKIRSCYGIAPYIEQSLVIVQ